MTSQTTTDNETMIRFQQDSVPGFSKAMIEWHRSSLTFPHTIAKQCESIRNHAISEGGIDHHIMSDSIKQGG